MIIKLHFPKLRNSELMQFISDAGVFCAEQDSEQSSIKKWLDILLEKGTDLQNAIRRARRSSITGEIKQLDKKRGECIVGIRSYADSLTHHFKPDIKKAALLIVASIDRYGKNIQNMNYQAETSTIRSLTGRWKSDTQLAEAITFLNLGEWATELETINAQFSAQCMLRVNEKASAFPLKTSVCRKAATESLKDLMRQIEARAMIADDKPYDGLIRELNALIKKYNIVANSHVRVKAKVPERHSVSLGPAVTSGAYI